MALVSCQSLVAQARGEFHDFSAKGGDYKALKDLKFKADDVSFLGFEETEFFGKSYRASKFSVNTLISIQILSAIRADGGEISQYKSALANFEIYIAQDDGRAVHDGIVKDMFELWSRKELYSGKWFYDFSSNGSDYILTCTPDLVNVKLFYLLWVKNRLIKVSFKRFQSSDDDGWGIMDSFTRENFRIHLNDKDYPAYSYPLRPKKDFIKLFLTGFFNSN